MGSWRTALHEETRAGAVHEELQLWEGLRLEKFVKGCFLWEQGKSVSNLPSVEEGEAEPGGDELSVTFIPCSPVMLGGGEGWENWE